MKKIKPSDYFLTVKRRYKYYIRSHEYRFGVNNPQNVLQTKYISSILALVSDSCSLCFIEEQPKNQFYRIKKKKEDKKCIVNVPKIFSIIENPAESLKAIIEFTQRAKKHCPTEIYIDHGTLNQFDLAAEVTLDHLVSEYKAENCNKTKKIHFSGEITNTHRIVKFMKGIGILNKLKIKGQQLNDSEKAQVEIFTRRNRKSKEKITSGSSSYNELITGHFIDHVDNCLARSDLKLTKSAITKLSTYTGELLDNIEQHSGMNEWLIVGYLDSTDKDKLCEIAVVNFGYSFADTFSSVPNSSYVHGQIEKYLKELIANGVDVNSNNTKCYLTLYAIQEAVSSKNLTKGDLRGQGTADFIMFFQQMYEQCKTYKSSARTARMAILSGDVHILFDGNYKMSRQNGGHRVIAFNQANDLTQKYDSDYITRLQDVSFPGTIISIQFPIGQDLVEATNEQKEN